jgi:hypothetical protein
MKILEQSHQRLVLKKGSPEFLIISLIFLFLGALCIAITYAGVFDMEHIELKNGVPTVIPPARNFAERKIPLLVGIGIAAIGLPILLFGVGSLTCTFDKAGGDVVFERKRLLGSRTDAYRLKEIASAEVEASTSTDSEGSSSTCYRTALVFTDGRRVPLGAVYTSNRAAFEQLAKTINSFLHGS